MSQCNRITIINAPACQSQPSSSYCHRASLYQPQHTGDGLVKASQARDRVIFAVHSNVNPLGPHV